MHVPKAEGSPPLKKNVVKHSYADAASPGFVIPGHPDFIVSAAAVVQTRSLAFLKGHLGEIFDLEDLWDQFLQNKFDERSVEKIW
jgi:carboxymethylenebutenolidase